MTLASVVSRGESPRPAVSLTWHAFPDASRFVVLGLPWFPENQPKLWRLPASQMRSFPRGVQNRAKASSGGRLAFRTDSPSVAVRFRAEERLRAGDFETFVDGQPLPSVSITERGEDRELVWSVGLDRTSRDIVIYLPHVRQTEVVAIGLEAASEIALLQPTFSQPLPLVLYGSSVCQGSGAERSGQSYGAILARRLNLDLVNLGFGGAGKAEPEVVAKVDSLEACCFMLDLGKSYGDQDGEPFRQMLKALRDKHPLTPLIVVTPITSTKEVEEAAYSERSLHTRRVMREATQERLAAGDRQLYLVEGEELLGFDEHAWLSKDGVHPSDSGYAMMADKLLPLLQRVLAR
jgi:lysophospholipase L1-like esterase